MKHIAIIDFGSQYTHLIGRKVREFGVLSRIYHHDVMAEELRKEEVVGIIFSGGPQSVNDDNSPKIDETILSLKIPILGICYGHQLIAYLLGGRVNSGKEGEYGRAEIQIKNKKGIFQGLNDFSQVWMSHWDEVVELPAGFELTASSTACDICAMANFEKNIYSVQFHPEVKHSRQGGEMLENFVLKICNATKNWKVKDQVDDLLELIREKVGKRKVFILVSGGVDSNVAFALLNKALGTERVIGLYIDNGFMRLGESRRIAQRFEDLGYDNLRIVDASDYFIEKMTGLIDPEEKRAVIGQAFLDVKELEVEKLKLNKDDWILGQGTIYPDIIESGGSKNADKIKTHHNRVAAIEKLIEQGLVIEPLEDFYKDEVRKIGQVLGLPEVLIKRHPFPGPGLAIRCLCFKVGIEIDIEVEKEVVQGFVKDNFQELNSQFLPIKSVGVQGDNRTYAHPILLWGVDDWEELDRSSSKITNSLKEVNRCLLWLNPHPHKEFNFPEDERFLTKKRLDILRQVDDLVHRRIREFGIYDEIWQFPVVLLPVVDCSEKEAVVLRPIVSIDGMTLDFYRMKRRFLEQLTMEILQIEEVGNVFYDITNKPPGTTEWE